MEEPGEAGAEEGAIATEEPGEAAEEGAVATEEAAEGEEAVVAEASQNAFIINMSLEELEQAPEFDLAPLYDPLSADATSLQTLEQEIHAFWQTEQPAESTGAKSFLLAENLFGASVQPGTAGEAGAEEGAIATEEPGEAEAEEGAMATEEPGEAQTAQAELGAVEEIMVDTSSGKVTYLLVSLSAATPGVAEAPAGDAETAETPLEAVPVPLTALEWNAEEAIFTYIGSEALDQAPTVNLDEIMSDQIPTDWLSEADSFWGVEGSETE
jgi:hypothetical protein